MRSMIHVRPLAVAALLSTSLVLSPAPAAAQAPAWKELFKDGTLDGFQIVSGSATYEVVDGVLVGTTTEGSPNTFLATNAPLKDFELEFEVKVDDELNSGVQVRSHLAKEGEKPEGAGGRCRPADSTARSARSRSTAMPATSTTRLGAACGGAA